MLTTILEILCVWHSGTQNRREFFCEISHLDTECFQEFINEFSCSYPKDLHIVQLDNGSFQRMSEKYKFLR